MTSEVEIAERARYLADNPRVVREVRRREGSVRLAAPSACGDLSPYRVFAPWRWVSLEALSRPVVYRELLADDLPGGRAHLIYRGGAVVRRCGASKAISGV